MLKNIKLGIGITGSFCTLNKSLQVIEKLKTMGLDLYIFVSDKIKTCDTRFNQAQILLQQLENLSNKKLIDNIVTSETFGPVIPLDLMLVMPTSSNTLAKLANGINDNAVTMACKSTLRNNRNVVLALATNDALSNSGINMMKLLNTKNYYLVPMYQDDYINKPNSLIFDETKVIDTLVKALNNQQIQPVFQGIKNSTPINHVNT